MMGGTNHNRVIHDGGSAGDRDGAWDIDRAALWAWLSAALHDVTAPALDRRALRGLCLQTLDTHAPAALVHAQAAGILIERLVCASLVEAYVDTYGPCDGRYDVKRLRAVARRLSGEAPAGDDPGVPRAS